MIISLGVDRNIKYFRELDETKHSFFDGEVDVLSVVRYLKGVYTNKERFISRCMPLFSDGCCSYIKGLSAEMLELYDTCEPYTYKECFLIKNEEYKNIVWGSINIVDMINELGKEMIAVEGKPVRHKQYNYDGEFTGYKEYDVIYETHKIDCAKLGVEDSYAVRCWCTTTDEEHWLWVSDEHKDSPLDAIAATFMVHKSVKPHIKEIKRQGDILLLDMKKEVNVPKGDPMVSFTADEYFGLLTAQS
jgi:hypothetical protein